MFTRIVKQILGVIATGYILFYFSELVFWARVQPTDTLPEWISTWLAYSLLAFVFLTIVARFRVHTVWALFLAGAVFGWMTEGIVVQTAYEDLPLSLSFTGLAWHALISVWVGWYAVRRALFSGLKATLARVYCHWNWVWTVGHIMVGGTGEMPAPPLEFAQYALISTLLLFSPTGFMTAPCRSSNPIVRSRSQPGYFFCCTLHLSPSPLLRWLQRFSLFYFSWSIWHCAETSNGKPARRCTNAFLAPISPGVTSFFLQCRSWHALVYAATYALGVRWPTNILLYLITTPAGFILFIIQPRQSVADEDCS